MGEARISTVCPTLTGNRMHCICCVMKHLAYTYTPSYSMPCIYSTYVYRGSWALTGLDIFAHISRGDAPGCDISPLQGLVGLQTTDLGSRIADYMDGMD